MRLRRVAGSMVGVAALLACGGATGPSLDGGRYTLRAVEGAPLPAAVLYDQRGAVAVRATGAALTFLSGGRVEWVRAFETVAAGRAGESVVGSAPEAYRGTYTRRGDRLLLEVVSDAGADRYPWRIEARAGDRVVTLYVPLAGVHADPPGTRAEEYRRE